MCVCSEPHGNYIIFLSFLLTLLSFLLSLPLILSDGVGKVLPLPIGMCEITQIVITHILDHICVCLCLWFLAAVFSPKQHTVFWTFRPNNIGERDLTPSFSAPQKHTQRFITGGEAGCPHLASPYLVTYTGDLVANHRRYLLNVLVLHVTNHLSVGYLKTPNIPLNGGVILQT